VATYAIGDVQGCHDALERLLDGLKFEPGHDRLWLVGDLVNRGGQSLQVLRLLHSLREAVIVVLGNHDLAVLAQIAGVAFGKPREEIQTIVDAPDGTELIDWLRRQPLAHYDSALDCGMIHAGLSPDWDMADALRYCAEVSAVLRGAAHVDFLRDMPGDHPTRWHESLRGNDRLRAIVSIATRMRYLDRDERMEFQSKGPLREHPELRPWFTVRNKAWGVKRLLFGHWASLGLVRNGPAIGLDTGCVWGGPLTALRLDSPAPQITQLDPSGQLRQFPMDCLKQND